MCLGCIISQIYVLTIGLIGNFGKLTHLTYLCCTVSLL